MMLRAPPLHLPCTARAPTTRDGVLHGVLHTHEPSTHCTPTVQDHLPTTCSLPLSLPLATSRHAPITQVHESLTMSHARLPSHHSPSERALLAVRALEIEISNELEISDENEMATEDEADDLDHSRDDGRDGSRYDSRYDEIHELSGGIDTEIDAETGEAERRRHSEDAQRSVAGRGAPLAGRHSEPSARFAVRRSARPLAAVRPHELLNTDDIHSPPLLAAAQGFNGRHGRYAAGAAGLLTALRGHAIADSRVGLDYQLALSEVRRNRLWLQESVEVPEYTGAVRRHHQPLARPKAARAWVKEASMFAGRRAHGNARVRALSP
jgi:hypothetical protein